MIRARAHRVALQEGTGSEHAGDTGNHDAGGRRRFDAADAGSGYDNVTYLIGKCWDPSMAVEQEPTRLEYNCDGTAAMENMNWTSWRRRCQRHRYRQCG